MKIEVLGVGGAFSPELGNSSIVIWDDKEEGFLIDCGYSVFAELKKKNYLDKINKVFITHTHSDHIGSLDTFFYYRRFVLNKNTQFYGLHTYIPYLNVIDPGFLKEDLENFFEPIKESIQVVPHLEHCTYVKNSAFYNYTLLYSGDVNHSLLEEQIALEAKIILHEVSFQNYGVHAYFEKLKKAPLIIKQKTWLYHYNVGDYEKYNETVKECGFAGMLTQGQILEI